MYKFFQTCLTKFNGRKKGKKDTNNITFDLNVHGRISKIDSDQLILELIIENTSCIPLQALQISFFDSDNILIPVIDVNGIHASHFRQRLCIDFLSAKTTGIDSRQKYVIHFSSGYNRILNLEITMDNTIEQERVKINKEVTFD